MGYSPTILISSIERRILSRFFDSKFWGAYTCRYCPSWSLENCLRIFSLKAELKEEKEQKAWLKEQHNFGTNAATWIIEYSVGKSPWEGDPESYLIAGKLNDEYGFYERQSNRSAAFERL